MRAEVFTELIGSEFYTGVPDSQLKALCDYLTDRYGTDPKHHIIAANEGNCAAIAAGYHLATGQIPVVYMQNSGEGNIINPAASLLNEKVYGIPCIFVIGWRGEPGIHDEPQHIFQGEVTLKLLEDMEIEYFVVSRNTGEEELKTAVLKLRRALEQGRQAAFVIRKNALTYEHTAEYGNSYTLKREEIIRHITAVSGGDLIVSTTGKASRELFEIREEKGQGHQYDFLTVGSMGHSSSVALGLALHKPDKRIWCIDGDGAVLMHMGAMAVIGANRPKNMIHVVINNGAHETVGGMPTVASDINLTEIAGGCGYPNTVCADTAEALDRALEAARDREDLSFIEVKCAIGARADLGRPTTTAAENKRSFMENLLTFRRKGEAE